MPEPIEEAAAPEERRVGRYRILQRIASGGMGTVHLASARGAGGFERLVAAKLLHPHLAEEDEFVTMFLDEARLAARIHHPNVVATIDVIGAPHFVIVMELVEGAHLGVLWRRARARSARVPMAVSIRIALDALQGLAAAHDLEDETGRPLGLVHRDVSPQNVLVGADGITRLTDFGVARAESRLTATREGTLKGKLGYMAPEQIAGAPADRRADLFAMGVVLWECLSGERLFTGETDAEIARRVASGAVAELSSFAPELAPLDQVVRKALARDPERRYASAREMARELESCAPAIASAHVVGDVVRDLAPDHFDLRAQSRARLGAERSGLVAKTAALPIPEQADEVTRPVTTAARRRLVEDTRSAPAPAETPRRRWWWPAALAGLVVLLGLGLLLARETERAPAETTAAAPIDRAEPTLLEGEPPLAPEGTTFVPTIELLLEVDEEGRVGSARVERSRAELADLEARALAAARGWRFAPATRDGRPVRSQVRWPVELALAAPGGRMVRIKGSDTLGAEALPAIARAFRAVHPEVRVDVEALGSSTGFVGLFDGSADVAASSRAIRQDEIDEAARLGIVVHELLIGWDGIAVIVARDSDRQEITLDEVRAIYTDPSVSLRAVTRPRESGTFGFFTERVMRAGEVMRSDAITIEHSADIVRYVGTDPGSIGYVGVGFVSPEVRALAVASDGAAVAPDPEVIEDGRYPLARPLLLYVRDRPSAATVHFLEQVFAEPGRAAMVAHGFVAAARAPAALSRLRSAPPGRTAAPTRLLFGAGAAAPDERADAELARFVAALSDGDRVAVRGHAGQGEPDPDALAARRAEAVRALLVEAGVAATRIDVRALGATQPIGPQSSDARSRLSRRVDLYAVGR